MDHTKSVLINFGMQIIAAVLKWSIARIYRGYYERISKLTRDQTDKRRNQFQLFTKYMGFYLLGAIALTKVKPVGLTG